LLVIEEGQGFAGFGGELIARLAEESSAPAVMRRLSAAPQPIPSSRQLEQLALPNRETIVQAALGVLNG
jgi:2-oxoisovalerate dehydrogenase E1 component